MSDASAPLGPLDPAGSRHGGRRSAVALHDDLIVVGRADGDLLGFDAATLDRRWRAPCDRDATSVVAAEPFAGGVLVGERSPRGEVRLHDAGDVRWRLATAEAVGRPDRTDRFSLPFVADLAVADGRAFVAARRYDRDADSGGRRPPSSRPSAGDGPAFEGVVLALDPDGAVAWRARTDASPTALDAAGDRVAVAYNRCPGDHDAGLVVHDAATGAATLRWDPTGGIDTEGARNADHRGDDAPDRRVGDVALCPDGVAVASHADHRGYRLSGSGDVRWRVDVATTTAVDGEAVYAYPNHVHATPAGVAYVTGNTYPVEGRSTDARHARATTALGYAPGGDGRWTASLGGFAPTVAAAGRRLVVPVAQGFRTRDPAVHGVRVLDLADGPLWRVDTAGVVTAVATGDRTVAVEEPVRYHDDGERRGEYRLHAVGTPN